MMIPELLSIQKKSDTQNIILSNALNRHLEPKKRAMVIKHCCKQVRDRTKCKTLQSACRNIIKHVSKGDYASAILTIEISEQRYWDQYA